MALINLDLPERFPPVSGDANRRPRLWILSVILVVTGGLVGGLVTHRWQTDKLREANGSVASVVALADFSGSPGVPVQWSASAGGKTTAVSLDAHVTIVNTGPMTIDVLGFTVDQPGMVLRGNYAAGRVRPSAKMAAQLYIEVDCAVSRRLLAVPLSISLETLADHRREIAVTVGGSPWVQKVEAACVRLAQRLAN